MSGMHELKLLSKKQLKAVAAEGRRKGFNRQIEPALFRKMADDRIILQNLMEHEHVADQRVTLYYRCQLVSRLKGDDGIQALVVDVTKDLFDALPRFSAATKGG